MAFSLFESKDKIINALSKTRQDLGSNLVSLFQANPPVDESLWQDIEDLLVSADVGIETSGKLILEIKKSVQKHGISSSNELLEQLKFELLNLLKANPENTGNKDYNSTPFVIMVVGVNGVGKTTSVAKLAAYYQGIGKSVLLGAGDTFRAAAIDQLKIWGEKLGVDVVAHQQGSDPGAVAFDAYNAAIARQVDILIYDTAGRLHNKTELMEELSKVNRVFKRISPNASHQTLLVIDATTGQNGIEQAKNFKSSAEINAIFLAKLDSSAKGGVTVAISDQLGIPVRFVGTGESVNDLSIFDPEHFVNGLFNEI